MAEREGGSAAGDRQMSPWQTQRRAEEARRKEAADLVPDPLDREPAPTEVCTDQPVFLASAVDAEDEFLDDLTQPGWNPGARWMRVVAVLVPVTRSRILAEAGDFFLLPGDAVILSTARGIELAHALGSPRWREVREEVKNRVLRCCGVSDERQMSRNDAKALESFEACRAMIEKRNLDMKLLRVEFLHGGGKAIIYFTAEKRIDFRQLIRDLAIDMHTRIEMRQIGVRDAARMMGGVGPCGEHICCSRFLTRFAPVSIRMAKVQNLMLNPQKVSGVCGRLLCCLEYEHSQYCKLAAEAPRYGSPVVMPDGSNARVRDVMLIQGKCMVEHPDGSTSVVAWTELTYSRGERREAGADRDACCARASGSEEQPDLPADGEEKLENEESADGE